MSFGNGKYNTTTPSSSSFYNTPAAMDDHHDDLDFLLNSHDTFEGDSNGVHKDYTHNFFSPQQYQVSTNNVNTHNTTTSPSTNTEPQLNEDNIEGKAGEINKEHADIFSTQVRDVKEDAEKLRVSMELEFVQCLANPRYLHFLAQQRYFQDQAFVNYLKYLLYWKEPEYAKFVVYPHCLFFLEQLQEESFRKELVNANFVELLWRQQFNHWRYPLSSV